MNVLLEDTQVLTIIAMMRRAAMALAEEETAPEAVRGLHDMIDLLQAEMRRPTRPAPVRSGRGDLRMPDERVATRPVPGRELPNDRG